MKELGWKDHFTRAAGFANLVTVAADRVADPQTQAELRAVARVINQDIEAGTVKAEAKMDALNPPMR
jgi:hypothetical protein